MGLCFSNDKTQLNITPNYLKNMLVKSNAVDIKVYMFTLSSSSFQRGSRES